MPLSHRSSGEFKAPKQSVRDIEENLREQLQQTNTKLNKLQTERDRLETTCKQLQKTCADTIATVAELQAELSDVKKERDQHNDDLEQSKADYAALLKTHKSWLRDYTELQNEHDSLLSRYNTAKGTSSASSPLSSPIPERPKEVRTVSKKESKEHREPREERERRKDRDRKQSRDRGRDKEREKREHEELAAEKKRLSKRFEERRPPPAGRRGSVSQWSSSGTRSTSANPNSRTYTSNRAQPVAVVSQAQPAYGSSVPRTPNPLSPTGAYSSGSSGFNDDESYEDGNYHAYPIQR